MVIPTGVGARSSLRGFVHWQPQSDHESAAEGSCHGGCGPLVHCASLPHQFGLSARSRNGKAGRWHPSSKGAGIRMQQVQPCPTPSSPLQLESIMFSSGCSLRHENWSLQMVWVTLRQPLEISRNQDLPSGSAINVLWPSSSFRPFRVLRGRIFVGCGAHLWLRHAFSRSWLVARMISRSSGDIFLASLNCM